MVKSSLPDNVEKPNRKSNLKFVSELTKDCLVETKHTKQVTRIALKLFDDLQSLHHLGKTDRFYLQCAGLLHDIGVHTHGSKGHHKATLNIILSTPILQFSNKERLIIGSIARYHRKALPTTNHDHFKALTMDERKRVSILSGLLRIADGLDYTHRRRIGSVRAHVKDEKIIIECLVRTAPVRKEIESAKAKSDLLAKLYQQKIVFRTQ